MSQGQRKHDRTAADFRMPLLMVLGELSDWKAGVEVRFDQTYEPICQKVGVTIDQYGIQQSANRPWVVSWIQEAFKAERRQDRTLSETRGQWTLTEKGLKTAMENRAAKASPKTEDPNTAIPASGVSFPVGPGYAEEAYHKDPYIRTLAIRETACFGQFATKSDTCQGSPEKNRAQCPLSGPCRNFMASEFSSLAAKLRLEDAKPAARPSSPSKGPAKAAAPSTPPAKSAWSDDEVEEIIAAQKAVCTQCAKEIPEGSACLWARPSTSGRKSGLMHIGCRDGKGTS